MPLSGTPPDPDAMPSAPSVKATAVRELPSMEPSELADDGDRGPRMELVQFDKFSMMGDSGILQSPHASEMKPTNAGSGEAHPAQQSLEPCEDQHLTRSHVHTASRRWDAVVAVSAAVSAPSEPPRLVDIDAVRSENFVPRTIPKTPAEEADARAGVVRCHLFANMDEASRRVVIAALKKEEYSAGMSILQQGGACMGKFFILATGKCDVIRNGKRLTSIECGSTFGELEMMYAHTECAATIRCVTNCVLYVLDSDHFYHLVMDYSIKQRKRYEQLLRNVPFLAALPQYDRMKLAEALLTATFQKDETIIKFGEHGDWMHIILRGVVQVVAHQGGKRVNVARLSEGDVVGELEFLFGHLAVADVIAVTESVTTARINRDHFEMVVGPIQTQLKQFVSENPTYQHYRERADDGVKAELENINRRARRQEERRRLHHGDSLPWSCRANMSSEGHPLGGESSIAGTSSVSGDSLQTSAGEVCAPLSRGGALLRHVEKTGEIILLQPVSIGLGIVNSTQVQSPMGGADNGCDRGPPSPVGATIESIPVRFPLKMLEVASSALFALREDGVILFWNDTMVRYTGYAASEILGENVYSFLYNSEDQRSLHDALDTARMYAGDIEQYYLDGKDRCADTYTFARGDGLTKVVLQVTFVPPSFSFVCSDVAMMVLAICQEVRRKPAKTQDHTQMLADRVRVALQDGDLTFEERLNCIADYVNHYDVIQQAMNFASEDLRAVSVRQLIGQVIMEYGTLCVRRNVTLRQCFESMSVDHVFIDSKLLPECLRYAMERYTTSLANAEVTISVSTIVANNAMEFLVIDFHDTGDGFTAEELEEFRGAGMNLLLTDARCLNAPGSTQPTAAPAGGGTGLSVIQNVKWSVEKQGGMMTITSEPRNVKITFYIPYIIADEDEGDPMGVGASAAGRSGTAARSTNPHESNGLMLSGEAASHASTAPTATSMAGGGSQIKEVGPGASSDLQGNPSGNSRHRNFTTLVVEDTPAHRNMICSFLWERRHAVLSARDLADLERLIDVVDVLVIDPQQSLFEEMMATFDPFKYLRDRVRRMAIIITGSRMDSDSLNAYHTAGFFTLSKPCTAIQGFQVLRKVEDRVDEIKSEIERIELARATLAKNSRGAWRKVRLLGKGAFGEVFEVVDVLTGGTMAMKEMKKDGNVHLDSFVSEIATMYELQNPNIIHYFYCENKPEEPVIRVFMEYASGGNVQDYLRTKGMLEFNEVRKLLRGIVDGLAYIHSQKYVHCDIKTANIMLGTDGEVKIGDFGTAKRLNPGQFIFEMQGSPLYMSPECMSAGDEVRDTAPHAALATDANEARQPMRRIGYSMPTDIWSLGCVALEIATLKPPFSHLHITSAIALMNYITSLKEPPDLSKILYGQPQMREFVSACLQPNPANRATAEQLLTFKIFREDADAEVVSAMKVIKRAQLMHAYNKFATPLSGPEKTLPVLHVHTDSSPAHARKRISTFGKGKLDNTRRKRGVMSPSGRLSADDGRRSQRHRMIDLLRSTEADDDAQPSQAKERQPGAPLFYDMTSPPRCSAPPSVASSSRSSVVSSRCGITRNHTLVGPAMTKKNVGSSATEPPVPGTTKKTSTPQNLHSLSSTGCDHMAERAFFATSSDDSDVEAATSTPHMPQEPCQAAVASPTPSSSWTSCSSSGFLPQSSVNVYGASPEAGSACKRWEKVSIAKMIAGLCEAEDSTQGSGESPVPFPPSSSLVPRAVAATPPPAPQPPVRPEPSSKEHLTPSASAGSLALPNPSRSLPPASHEASESPESSAGEIKIRPVHSGPRVKESREANEEGAEKGSGSCREDGSSTNACSTQPKNAAAWSLSASSSAALTRAGTLRSNSLSNPELDTYSTEAAGRQCGSIAAGEGDKPNRRRQHFAHSPDSSKSLSAIRVDSVAAFALHHSGSSIITFAAPYLLEEMEVIDGSCSDRASCIGGQGNSGNQRSERWPRVNESQRVAKSSTVGWSDTDRDCKQGEGEAYEGVLLSGEDVKTPPLSVSGPSRSQRLGLDSASHRKTCDGISSLEVAEADAQLTTELKLPMRRVEVAPPPDRRSSSRSPAPCQPTSQECECHPDSDQQAPGVASTCVRLPPIAVDAGCPTNRHLCSWERESTSPSPQAACSGDSESMHLIDPRTAQLKSMTGGKAYKPALISPETEDDRGRAVSSSRSIQQVTRNSHCIGSQLSYDTTEKLCTDSLLTLPMVEGGETHRRARETDDPFPYSKMTSQPPECTALGSEEKGVGCRTPPPNLAGTVLSEQFCEENPAGIINCLDDSLKRAASQPLAMSPQSSGKPRRRPSSSEPAHAPPEGTDPEVVATTAVGRKRMATVLSGPSHCRNVNRYTLLSVGDARRTVTGSCKCRKREFRVPALSSQARLASETTTDGDIPVVAAPLSSGPSDGTSNLQQTKRLLLELEQRSSSAMRPKRDAGLSLPYIGLGIHATHMRGQPYRGWGAAAGGALHSREVRFPPLGTGAVGSTSTAASPAESVAASEWSECALARLSPPTATKGAPRAVKESRSPERVPLSFHPPIKPDNSGAARHSAEVDSGKGNLFRVKPPVKDSPEGRKNTHSSL